MNVTDQKLCSRNWILHETPTSTTHAAYDLQPPRERFYELSLTVVNPLCHNKNVDKHAEFPSKIIMHLFQHCYMFRHQGRP